MTRRELKLIADHIDTSLWLADGLPIDPDYDCIKVALWSVRREVENAVKSKERQERERAR